MSTGIFVLFQRFQHWEVHTLQAIVLNYGVAAALGWVLCGGSALFTSVQSEPWVWVALGMGLLFIYLFQLIARTTQTLNHHIHCVKIEHGVACGPVLGL